MTKAIVEVGPLMLKKVAVFLVTKCMRNLKDYFDAMMELFGRFH